MLVMTWSGVVAADEDDGSLLLSASQVFEMIEANGDYAIDLANADMDIAHARLAEAGAGLMPRLTLSATTQFYRPSSASYPDDNAEAYGSLEIVQPIYDFGQTANAEQAAQKVADAAAIRLLSARNTILLEGLALFYNLHASELEIRALYEGHTSAYLGWDRAKENLTLGRASPVDVAKTLTVTEQTRLAYFRERSRNVGYRLRLEELVGKDLPGELISPPPPPKKKHADVNRKAFLAAMWDRNLDLQALAKQAEGARLRRAGIGSLPRLNSFANTGYTTRDLRGRTDYAVGARLSWPIFDGGITRAKKSRLAGEESQMKINFEAKKRELRRQAITTLLERDDAYQRVLSALAGHDYTSKNLLRRQQLYDQERVADLGRAMIDHTKAEAELVRATGSYYMVRARIALLLGEHPNQGLNDEFLGQVIGVEDHEGESFVPKSGTGFGQQDQDQFKK